jgi:hypothetical protein
VATEICGRTARGARRRQAAPAPTAHRSGEDRSVVDRPRTRPCNRSSCEGKLDAARYFCTQILPRLISERLTTENTDFAPMELDEAAFRAVGHR